MTSAAPARRVLPDFPWDTLAAAKVRAGAHPGGIVDLSVGTPVDPTPEVVSAALAQAADSPGYPATWGTPELRDAIAGYLGRRWNATVEPRDTLPVIGTKELVGWLPTLLGLGADDPVVLPTTAYPTYAVGAAMTGSPVVTADTPAAAADKLAGRRPGLVWVNSPANPTGWTQTPAELAAWVAWARQVGALLASDECYGEFGWEAEPVSVLDADVCGGSNDQLVVVGSLSKRSNLAGYRAGFVAGDTGTVADLLAVRKHLGMIMPAPVQAAMAAGLVDQAHVDVQRQRYARRRALLRPALESAGFRIEHSESGLYLWATRDESGRASVDALAELGILVAPGDFYGDASADFVRVALTGTDERVEAAAARLTDRSA